MIDLPRILSRFYEPIEKCLVSCIQWKFLGWEPCFEAFSYSFGGDKTFVFQTIARWRPLKIKTKISNPGLQSYYRVLGNGIGRVWKAWPVQLLGSKTKFWLDACFPGGCLFDCRVTLSQPQQWCGLRSSAHYQAVCSQNRGTTGYHLLTINLDKALPLTLVLKVSQESIRKIWVILSVRNEKTSPECISGSPVCYWQDGGRCS